MAGDYSSVTDELKNAYPTGTFPDAVNKEAPYRASLNRVDLTFSEGIAKFPMALESSWAVGAIADGGAFPAGNDPTRPQGQVVPEFFVATFQLGILAKYVGKSSKGSFNAAGLVADRIERTVADLGKYINRVYAGSNVGRLAVSDVDGTNTFTVKKDPVGLELLDVGMSIEARDALSSGSIVGSFENQRITELNRSTLTVTYAGTDRTITSGSHIFLYGTHDRTFYTLPDIVDDGTNAGTIFGLSRTTYPGAKAHVNGAGGVLRNLTEQLILDATDIPRRETGKKITRALANSGQCRKYVEFVAAARRYPQSGRGTPQYSVGYDDDSLEINIPGMKCKLECDFDIPPREIYFVPWDTFGLYEAFPLDWVEEDGKMLHLQPNTTSGHNASLLAYAASIENQICSMPKACARLEDLKDPIFGDT